MQIILLILGNVFMATIGQIFIKQGVNQIGPIAKLGIAAFLVKSFTAPLVLVGLLLYILSAILWVVILSKVPLSLAYPMLSMGYILILFFSWAFLHEHISPIRILGVFLIIGGVIFVFRS
jgi:drug/metabolite transporter (DMT)-like permease